MQGFNNTIIDVYEYKEECLTITECLELYH